ncbi:hypothetical protein LVD17_15140 [Fulvivirga ulvae]|uniref:hypothetical protein n=1 Tax=Fulvivirga ulvae TaxID=2904245 RepID=UPI001F16A172|nr:hypothetical protein [Fulvivirga ulvae]UII29634.1 hypothetical protein LVD17_15140 [Fulvivirga ulvae]
MKNFVSIMMVTFVLIRGLAPSMDICCELQKLPNLLEHYQQHKDCNGGASFLQFLAEDYFDLQKNADDHHDDNDHSNLPFQGDHQCCHSFVFYTFNQEIPATVINFIVDDKVDCYKSFFSSQFPDSLFQPPRV